MSKKGKKLGLGEFLGPDAPAYTLQDRLPTGPRQRDDGDDGYRGRGGGRRYGDREPSRSEQVDQWRGGGGGGFDEHRREPRRYGDSDEVSNWRGGGGGFRETNDRFGRRDDMPAPAPMERPAHMKLNLQRRAAGETTRTSSSSGAANPFGGARPVSTYEREEEAAAKHIPRRTEVNDTDKVNAAPRGDVNDKFSRAFGRTDSGDNFGRNDRSRYGGDRDRYGDRGFGNRDRYGDRPRFNDRDRYGGDRDRYGGDSDRYGGDRDRYGGDRDRYGGDRDRFGGGDRDRNNRFGGDRDRFGGERGGWDRTGERGNYRQDGDRFNRLADRSPVRQEVEVNDAARQLESASLNEDVASVAEQAEKEAAAKEKAEKERAERQAQEEAKAKEKEEKERKEKEAREKNELLSKEVASAIAASDKRGKELTKFAKELYASKIKASGADVLSAILYATEEAKSGVEWTAPEQYGDLLADLIYPSDAATEQLKSLYALQRFFHSISFPKGLLEKVFMALYQNDIVDEEAFIAYKYDVDDETPGKMKAIIETTQWLAWLETADEEEDEDEEDPEEI